MSFRLIPKLVTLSDREWLMTLILRYFAEFGSFRGPLCKSGWRRTDTFCNRNVAQSVYGSFYHAAWNADSVLPWEFCLSVRLLMLKMLKTDLYSVIKSEDSESIKGVDCDKTKEKSVQIFISFERSFILVFWEKEWLVGATPSTWNLGSTSPLELKPPILNQ